MEDRITAARELLATRSPAVFFTGAGLGADSGIPTFRGSGGLWRGFRAEELATPEAFAADPERVWEWYSWRRRHIREAPLHAGHEAIGRYTQAHPESTVVTQNVDDLHQRAGCPSIVELHGRIWVNRCSGCGSEREDRETERRDLPRCRCGGVERPGVVWFGEALPPQSLEDASQAMTSSRVVVVVGTSAIVQPAASFIQLAARHGAKLIEVNPVPVLEATEAIVLAGKAKDILPRIL